MKKAILTAVFALTTISAISGTTMADNAHSIGSDGTLGIYDYDENYAFPAGGKAIASWFNSTSSSVPDSASSSDPGPTSSIPAAPIRPSAYFHAELFFYNPSPIISWEIDLKEVFTTNDAEIWGLWDIYRDGVLTVDEGFGHAVDLDGPVAGGMFGIYVTNESYPAAYSEDWVICGLIDYRFDF